MNFSREELRKLAMPFLFAVGLIAAGIGLIAGANELLRVARVQLSVAQTERRQNAERLARIAEEEREVKEKIELYQRLKALHILGEERRLEWADAINRIRASRELLDLRYRVDRQRPLVSLPGKPGSVDFYASTMHVELQLLHEEDLLRFLGDLRDSGNAFYAVKKCTLSRTGQAVSGATMTPRLRAECDIDLVTIIDRAAKS